MNYITSNELRRVFLEFFNSHGHQIVESSPLVPGNDPTLLFTNAGMVQFKDVFLGEETRKYNRAVTSQRCVRAGGKHNDLENVGYTARHHTFFEMLGNFSFGDYFKEDAIRYAWEFLTEVLELPAERLWVTVYEEDDEASDIWINTVGIDPERFSRMGEKDNFWAMGDTGPCGPCSEIFFDHGPDVAGGPPGSSDEDGDRYVEIWNLVFMQFERGADGKMTPLPKPSVDTGMGLERTAAVMQGVHSNYEIDLFANLIAGIGDILDIDNNRSSSLNVIADHIRACCFLIVDGVVPGNEGRGYVLRRIIRRAIRHGKKLGVKTSFLHKLVGILCTEMGEAYPELVKSRKHLQKVLEKEELRFAETLDQGMEILEAAIADLDGNELPGEVVFKLYDTFGFPVDLTADIARERNLIVDQEGFDLQMQQQRSRARAASKFSTGENALIKTDVETSFSGYENMVGKGKVVAVYKNSDEVECLSEGDEGILILDITPFYAESGGQVGDTGVIESDNGSFQVADTQKSTKANIHHGKIHSGTIRKGDEVLATIDAERRAAIVINHSATHLLHAALRQELGDHVQQKGSLVAPERLRFDFSHYEGVTPEQLTKIEYLVNKEIRKNSAADIKMMGYDDAVKFGAIALFGEKYDDEVRVLSLGSDFSIELCGGTHVQRTGDIGIFKITSEGGVASGIRRIEAVTGKSALDWIDANHQILSDISLLLKSPPDRAKTKIEQLVLRNRKLEKEVLTANQQALTDFDEQVTDIDGIKIIAIRMDGADAKTLRKAVDSYKDKLQSAVVVIGAVENEKVRLAAGVTADIISRIKAGDVIQVVAKQIGGKGGGRPDFAQAGGGDPAGLDVALDSVSGWISDQLS